MSYFKSEISDIWITDAWFLKPFGERVEENYIYYQVKLSSTVKTRSVYMRCYMLQNVFWKMERLTLRAKFDTFLGKIFKPKLQN